MWTIRTLWSRIKGQAAQVRDDEAFDEEVRERGSTLSTGQKQLISFARAFLAAPSVLVNDTVPV